MDAHERNAVFANSAQRVAYSYLRSLVAFNPVQTEALDPQAQRDLHGFFKGFYSALYEAPEQFGLPLDEDACIAGGEQNPAQYKQEVKRKLDKPRARIEQGLDFLLLAGQRGRLSDAALGFERADYAALVKESKVKPPFIKGLAGVGLPVADDGGVVAVRCPAYPGMPAALQALATACAGYADSRQGRFNFARCDFRALDGCFAAGALDLYPVFDPVDRERLERLHQFFMDLHYKPVTGIGGIHGWEVQYQPRPKIKASPLARIEFSDRYKNPLQADIKCVATARLIPLIYQQPRALQQDFARRLNPCNGNKCNWCKDKKGLGPAVFEFDGIKRTVCWYQNPDIEELNEETLRVIEQYALMHEALG
jgi:hypothetical protein